jgi:hypothetical protein
MSAVQFGVATSALPEDLCSSYCHGNQPSFSYIYHSQERNNYRFELDDSEIDEFSFIPPIEIIGQKVCFTHNRQPVLYDGQSFIYSLSDLFKKIRLPETLDSELLDKIATIANYLARGLDYEYVKGTAKQEGPKVLFCVKNGIDCLWDTFSLKQN